MWDAAKYRRDLERLRLAGKHDLKDIIWTPIIDEDEGMMFIGAALNKRGKVVVAKFCVTQNEVLDAPPEAFWEICAQLTKAIQTEAAKDYAGH